LKLTGAIAVITEHALAAEFEQSAVRLLFIDALVEDLALQEAPRRPSR
jgi:hypothetical protein